MTTATLLRERMDATIERLDKACGKSFIPDNQKCSKTPVSRQQTPQGKDGNQSLRRNLGTWAGIAITGAVLGALGEGYRELKASGLPESAITPKEPPQGYYDSLTPGDLLYTTFEMAGGIRAHYAVYAGKNEAGEHTIFHAAAAKDSKGREVSRIKHETINSYNPTNSLKKTGRVDQGRTTPTTEQLHQLIEQLNGKDVNWTGFTQNCETFARSVVNDIPKSTQSDALNPLTAQLVRGILKAAKPGLEARGKLRTKDIQKVVKRVVSDSLMTPKAQAERILTPAYGGKPLTVMSVSLSPEGTPIGVFKGQPRPGQTHYYTFKMGQQVEFKRLTPKKDSAMCGCDECKKHKRTKDECECGGKADGLTKTHKVMREFKEGKLTTHGKPVTNRKQAIAIALSEQARVKKKKRPKGEAFEKVDALLARLDKKC